MLVSMTKVRGCARQFAQGALAAGRRSALVVSSLVAILAVNAAFAQDGPLRKVGTVTGLALPRFVSLKADVVNSRVGPGPDYAIAFVFRRAGLPVEILAEFESWRQVRDSEGGTGWVAASLVSGRRTAVVAPWIKDKVTFDLTSSPGGSSVVAKMEPGAIVDIVECDGQFCKAYAGDSEGWAPQKNLWGVYPGEVVK